MADTRDLLVRIRGNTGDFERSMGKVQSSSDGSRTSFLKLTGAVAAGQAIFNGARLAIDKVGGFVESSIKQYEDAETAQKELQHAVLDVSHANQAQLKSTEKLADSLSRKGVLDDDVIKMGLAQLSTFGLTNDSVQKLGKSMADLTVNQFGVKASGEDAVTAANIMAKALNGNFGALEKMGIHLTDAQRKMIKYGDETQRVNTINEVMSANLRTNQATALTTTEGKLAHLSNAYNDVKKKIGGAIVDGVQPFMDKLSNFVSSDQFQAWVEKIGPEIQEFLTKALKFLSEEVFPKLVKAIKTVVDIGKDLIKFYQDHKRLVNDIAQVLLALFVAYKIVSTGIQIVTAVTKIWQALSETNPWLLAIMAIITIVLLLITHWKTVKKVAEEVWHDVAGFFTNLWHDIENIFSSIWHAITNAFSSAWNVVSSIWSGVTSVFSGLVDGIKNAFKGLFDIITWPFRTAFNAVADFWNNTVGKLHWSIPKWIPGIGGHELGVPQIPKLAAGGIVDSATVAMIGEGKSPEAVIPLDKLPDMVAQINAQQGGSKGGAAPNLHIEVNVGMYAGMPVEKRQIALELYKELVRAARAQGVQMPMIGAVGVQ